MQCLNESFPVQTKLEGSELFHHRHCGSLQEGKAAVSLPSWTGDETANLQIGPGAATGVDFVWRKQYHLCP